MHAVPDTLDIPALIRSLKDQDPAQGVRLIETHISWVLITPSTAYKIKKPVKFSFVDFRALAQRKHFCEEEVRLNQRLAPEIYQGVVPILYCPTKGLWSIDPVSPFDCAEIVDWAVKMHAFNASGTLDQAGEIQPRQIDAIADAIASFHEHEKPIAAPTPFSSPAEIARIANENLGDLKAQWPNDPRIARLDDWNKQTLEKLKPFFEQRQVNGAVKDCHGDLHLGNIAWGNDKPIIFDCIEFSDTLRCIDVINEIAFLFMDLHAKGQATMAWRFLNRWLEHTGDYDGLKSLMFYASYRALVRAKISMHQNKPADVEKYLVLAEHFTHLQNPTLTLMHGFSGSGKTFESQRLLQSEGAIRLRSDVERKRLFGLKSTVRTQSAVHAGMYQELATEQTFDRLYDITERLLSAGFKVIVDATFLKRGLREKFIKLAKSREVPVRIRDMAVAPETCRERILSRQAQQTDASDATLEVLEQQLRTADPLSPEELALTMVSGTEPGA